MLPTIVRKIVLRGGSPYYYARKYLEMCSNLREVAVRKRLASALNAGATPSDAALVRRLRDHAFVTLDQPFDLTEELVAECRKRLASAETEVHASATGSRSSKFFWQSLLRDEDLTGDSMFIRYALQEHIVRCASMYLGEAPYLSDVSLQYSFDVKDADATHSQLWHKDFDDTRMFKVFVYCSDVRDEDDGPFHVADRQAVRGARSMPFLSTRRYDDERFFAFADRSRAQAVYGAAGTTFVCDTQRAFHYGSRCRRPRLACWFTYQSFAGLYPVRDRGPVTSPLPFAYVLARRLTATQIPAGCTSRVTRSRSVSLAPSWARDAL